MKTSFRLICLLMALAAVALSCSKEKYSSAEVRAAIVTPASLFTIDPNVDTTLVGKEGTRIFIEKGTFQFADGSPVTGPIEVKLEEFYDKSDMVAADLATVSDGKMLESGGMLNIGAQSQGKEVEIRGDKDIVVHFPKKNGPGYGKMDLFYADASATDSAATNWNVDTVDLVKRTLKIANWGWWWPTADDSTDYDFEPKVLPKGDYGYNPLDFYLNAYDFAPLTRKEIEGNLNHNDYPDFEEWNDYGIECEMEITKEGWVKNPKVNTKVSAATRKDVLNFLSHMPQLEPGRNKNGEIIERRGLLFIQGGAVVPLYKTREQYLKSFDQKYASNQNSDLKNVDDAELEYYIFSVGKLGWINCDRFWDAKAPVDFIVDTPVENGVKLKLIFGSINSVMAPEIVDGKYVFPKVPAGGEATVVALKNADGYLQAAFQKVEISETPLQNLSYQSLTLEELKEELWKLN